VKTRVKQGTAVVAEAAAINESCGEGGEVRVAVAVVVVAVAAKKQTG